MSTKQLLLASVAYITVGVVAGGLLANGAVLSSTPEKIQDAATTAARTVSNADAKQDRLVVAVNFSAHAPLDAQDAVADTPLTTGSLPPSTLSAYAAVPPVAREKIGPPVPWVGQPQPAPSKPKQASRHPSTYSVLSDEQIASVKERMKLTPYQAQYWPAIETALRRIGAKLSRNAKGGAEITAASIDPDSQEVQDLKNAAFPLLFTLSEDQKREVRTLARVIGLDAVASAI